MLLVKGRNKWNISENCNREKLCLIQELKAGLDATFAGVVQTQLTSRCAWGVTDSSTSTDSTPPSIQIQLFGSSLFRNKNHSCALIICIPAVLL